MASPQRRQVLPPASIQSLPARATEALELRRFREAIDLFKQLVKHEPRAEWKAGLNDAYCARARELAAKQMFKEAAMLLENTRAPDGALRAPLLYAACLIRDGQQQKAASHLFQAVSGDSLPAEERPESEALLAALLAAAPLPPASIVAESPALARWREAGNAARQALTSWVDGAPAEQLAPLLGRISLRSAFRPLRLLLQTLLAGPEGAERGRAVLATITPNSPFYPLSQAVTAALEASPAGAGLSPPQRRFVLETLGTPPAAVDAMDRLAAAAAAGPSALFAALLKRAGDKPDAAAAAELRSACLNLLPKIPDRIGQFEKQFGRLSALDRARIQALSAEAAENWRAAETAWLDAASAIANGHDARLASLSRAVIFRHLAELASRQVEIYRGEPERDPVGDYLARASKDDPGHAPTMLARLARLRALSRDQDWHRLADEAAQLFPEDREVLLQATESAVARQAYKKAAGFARRLLAIDPINPGLRRQMVDLQVSQARKQMRGKRPDLAARALEEATQWERADAPSGVLRLFRGLVALQEGRTEAGTALLREGVELAGGGVAGWFRALLEAELTKTDRGKAGWLREELLRARKALPTKQDVMAVVAALGTPDALGSKKLVSSLPSAIHGWLMAAGDLPWSPAEVQTMEDTLVALEQFGVLLAMARAGRRREPGEPIWRLHEIIARTYNDPNRLTPLEASEVNDIGQSLAARKDVHALGRLRRYLRLNEMMQPDDDLDFDDLPDDFDAAELLTTLMDTPEAMPKDIERELRRKVGEVGREAAVAELAAALASGGAMGLKAPRQIARQLAEMLIKMALDGGNGRRRGGRF